MSEDEEDDDMDGRERGGRVIDTTVDLSKVPTAKYSVISQWVRHSIPEQRICSIGCGGKNCKYESVTNWSKEQQAINGLFSTWITEDILAMSRPNTEMIERENIIEQFERAKIRSVINLQTPGEHSNCGPGLDPYSGFTYSPQLFMDNDISFYNFAWSDYGVGSMSNVCSMVQVMQFALTEGAVAIHCHAGLGRTGVLIACYLVYAERRGPDESINLVRAKRPGSIQTSGQLQCVREFAEFVKPHRSIFITPPPITATTKMDGSGGGDVVVDSFTLVQFLSRQRNSLHGLEARKLRYLPKVVYVCCNALLQLARRRCMEAQHTDRVLAPSQSKLLLPLPRIGESHSGGQLLDHAPSVHSHYPSARSRTPSGRMEHNIRTLGSTHSVSSSSTSSLSLGGGGSGSLPPITPRPVNLRHSVSLESFSAVEPSLSLIANWREGREGGSSGGLSPSSPDESSEGGGVVVKKVGRAEGVGREMGRWGTGALGYSEDVEERVGVLKRLLNEKEGAWKRLEAERDPAVLSNLLWTWIDQLKEPILSSQDLPIMLQHSSNPEAGLAVLDRGAAQTIMYIFYTVACLEPLASATRTAVIQRAVSTLTQQNMAVEWDPVLNCGGRGLAGSEGGSGDMLLRRTNNGPLLMRSQLAHRLLAFFNKLLRQYRRDLVCDCLNDRQPNHANKPRP